MIKRDILLEYNILLQPLSNTLMFHLKWSVFWVFFLAKFTKGSYEKIDLMRYEYRLTLIKIFRMQSKSMQNNQNQGFLKIKICLLLQLILSEPIDKLFYCLYNACVFFFTSKTIIVILAWKKPPLKPKHIPGWKKDQLVKIKIHTLYILHTHFTDFQIWLQLLTNAWMHAFTE